MSIHILDILTYKMCRSPVHCWQYFNNYILLLFVICSLFLTNNLFLYNLLNIWYVTIWVTYIFNPLLFVIKNIQSLYRHVKKWSLQIVFTNKTFLQFFDFDMMIRRVVMLFEIPTTVTIY